MTQILYENAICDALYEKMQQNPSLVIVGDQVTKGSKYKQTQNLCKKFGRERIIDLPPNENSIASISLGIAINGASCVGILRGEYLLRAMDTIVNQIAVEGYMEKDRFKTPIVLMADIGYVKNMSPVLMQSYESLFSVPGLTVIYPSDAQSANSLLKQAIDLKEPVLFLSHKNMYHSIYEMSPSPVPVTIGKASVLKEGTDITLITYGKMTEKAVHAEMLLRREEISVEIIDLLTIHPIDYETVFSSIKKTGKVLIVHEARKTLSIGSEITSRIAQSEVMHYLDAPIKILSGCDEVLSYRKDAFDICIPSVEDIYNEVLQLTC